MSKIRRQTCRSNAGAIARLFGASLLMATTTTPAVADPCRAPLPPPGSSFSGMVRYVGDGDSLCVGPASHPERWIEVRLGDFNVNRRPKRTPYRRPKGTPSSSGVTDMMDAPFALVAA